MRSRMSPFVSHEGEAPGQAPEPDLRAKIDRVLVAFRTLCSSIVVLPGTASPE